MSYLRSYTVYIVIMTLNMHIIAVNGELLTNN